MTFKLACGDVMPGCTAHFESTDRDDLMSQVARPRRRGPRHHRHHPRGPPGRREQDRRLRLTSSGG